MLTVRPDPPIEGAPEDALPPAWTVLSNGTRIGRAWASRYSEQVTLNINGISIVDTNINDALTRARRYFGDCDDEDSIAVLPGWKRASDDWLPALDEHVLIYRSDDDQPTWIVGAVHHVEPGAVDVRFVPPIAGGGRFRPSQVARYTGNVERLR